MDDFDNKGYEREEDKLRVDVLEAMERYRIMAHVFFRRLDKDEKIDALTEVAEFIRENS
jgi:hypothetical protein